MGAFNVVHTTFFCPDCRCDAPTAIQFKYGSTWQLAYALGDELRWGGNDVGRKGKALVVLDGAAEQCTVCGTDRERDFYVYVENDRLVRVELATGQHDFIKAPEPFIVPRDEDGL